MLRMMPDVTAQPERFYSRKPLKSEMNFLNKDSCAEQMHNYTGNRGGGGGGGVISSSASSYCTSASKKVSIYLSTKETEVGS